MRGRVLIVEDTVELAELYSKGRAFSRSALFPAQLLADRHPDLLHHAPRPHVVDRREAHDLTVRWVEMVEPPPQCCSSTLRRVAVTPRRAREPPADLDAGCEGCAPARRREPDEADELLDDS